MKKILYTIPLLLTSQFLYAQFWEEIQLPDTIEARSVFIASNGYLFIGGDNIYTSTDNGETWNLSLNSFCIKFTENSLGYIFSDGYLTTDFGSNWECIHNDTAWDDGYFCSNDILFASGPSPILNKGQVFRKVEINAGWEPLHIWDYNNYVEEFAQTSNGDLYSANYTNMGGGGGVYRSVDQGETFELVGLYNHRLYSIAVNSFDDIFVGNYGGGIYKSDDLGETWVNITDYCTVTDIVIDIQNNIYAATDWEVGTGGVLMSVDNGEIWDNINSGLTNLYVENLALSPDNYLYAVCRKAYGQNLFRSVNPVLSIKNINNDNINIRPNPVKNILIVNTSFMNKNMDFEIYNSFGQLTYKNNTKSIENNQIDVSNYLPGIYFMIINNTVLKFIKIN